MLKNLFILIPIALTACSSSQDQNIQIEKDYSAFPFEQMLIPGSLNDAKKTGFTECESSSYGYECSQKNPKEIFGVTPLKVYVVLNGNNNFKKNSSFESIDVRTIPQEKLSYREIHLDIPKDTYNEKCLEKNGLSEFSYPPTIKCIETKGINFLQHFLNENGWFESSSKSNYSYVKANMPIKIYVDRNDNVSISPSSIEENLDVIQRLKEKQSSEENKQKNAESVINIMKE